MKDLTKKEIHTANMLHQLCIHLYLAESMYLDLIPQTNGRIIRHEIKQNFNTIGKRVQKLVDSVMKFFEASHADTLNESTGVIGELSVHVSYMNAEDRSRLLEYSRKLFNKYEK